MTELSFTKQFLATLASRAIRIPADFCEDPRKLPSRTPYTLPQNKKPKIKRTQLTSASTSVPTANVTIKSMRGATITHPLPGTPLSSTILTLKHSLSTATKIPIDKLKLLLKGKVVTDLKTLTELGVEEGTDVSLSVMVMGGATPVISLGPTPPAEEKVELNAAPERKTDIEVNLLGEEVVMKKSVLKDDRFWAELRVFLKERLGNSAEEEPEDVLNAFRDAWAKRST